MTRARDISNVITDGGTVFNEAGADVDFKVESNNQANMLFVDGGNDIVSIVGGGNNTVGGFANTLQIEGTTGSTSSLSITRNTAGTSSPFLQLGKTRGTSVGSNTIVQNGDTLGTITFCGADGTNRDTNGAVIRALVDGTPGENDMPTALQFSTTADGASSSTERLRIDSSGRVMIGTTTEGVAGADELTVGNTSAGNGITIRSGTSNNGALYFSDGTSGSGEFDGGFEYSHGSQFMRFISAGSERMRLDTNGNLLFNLTSRLFADASSTINASVESNSVLRVNRATTDGTIIDFGKDGTVVGSIGSNSSKLFIAGGNAGFKFRADLTCIMPCNSDGSNSDNDLNLGQASVRFSTIFATTSSINTSDKNDKQDIEELTDAEKRVAVVAKGLIRKYRWKDAVSLKGDKARIHFGIMAQDLQDAFTAESLDASRYGMFCSDTWWELDGEIYKTKEEAPKGATEKTRLGVRYSELLAFIISAI